MMNGGPNMRVCRLQPREFCYWWAKVDLAILEKKKDPIHNWKHAPKNIYDKSKMD